MKKPLSQRSAKVMQLANQESGSAPEISTVDILLGLIKEGSGSGARVLVSLGYDLGDIRREAKRMGLTGPYEVFK